MISPGGMRASASVASVTLRKAFHSGRTGILGVGCWMLEMVDERMRKSEGQCRDSYRSECFLFRSYVAATLQPCNSMDQTPQPRR
jgi:hypothetical protein